MDDESKLISDKQFRFECLNLVITACVVDQSIDQIIEAATKFEKFINNG